MTSDRLREARRACEAHRAAVASQLSTGQADLFTALESVLDHAGDDWRDQALERIRQTAASHREFTIVDVDFPITVDNRARGAAMLAASKKGWIRRIGYVNGDRGRHSRPVVLWSSKLYRGPRDAA